MRFRTVAALGLLACAVGVAPMAVAESIVNSKHNLSTSGPGPVRAVSEQEICIFCHTPHNASPEAPLWNRTMSGATYTPYSSSTLDATVGQPTGASKLCLSCHDGTIALGDVMSRTQIIAMQTGDFMPAGPSLIGTDLDDDHPISFVYDGFLAGQDPQLKNPTTLSGPVKVDGNGELQCTSCHDAHDDQFGKFLVMDNLQSAMCVECHSMYGWDFGSHKLSTATWDGTGSDPWPTTDYTTVRDNACENCHQPHSAPGRDRLLHQTLEEENCFVCHSGTVAADNVQADFSKASVHPVTLTVGTHDPTETPSLMTRHVECQDCHNPHAARDAAASPPNVPGELDYVSGIDSSGLFVARASYTYEICFKCHADGPDKPGPYYPRVSIQDNVRLEFSTSNPSHHAVVGPGANPDVPSLLPPYTTSSVITCTDCHGSDTGASAGGSGPDGTHGSMYAPLLERRLDRPINNTNETAQAYAMCYKCHDRNSILSDNTFAEHDRHIGRTGCLTCHDPHGVQPNSGNPSGTHLINFASDIVFPLSDGTLNFIDDGFRAGTCNLNCHNKKHDAKNYP